MERERCILIHVATVVFERGMVVFWVIRYVSLVFLELKTKIFRAMSSEVPSVKYISTRHSLTLMG